jgi:hypothetical protein
MSGENSMRSKKGDLTSSALVGIIIAVIAILVVAFAFRGVVGTTKTTLSDSMCTLNAAVKTYIKTMPLIACNLDKVTIEADDWGACDPDENKGWKASYKETSRAEYLRYCATYQFYLYANQCWERYGKGELDLSTTETGQGYDCYKVTVENLEEGDHIFLDPTLLTREGNFREGLQITLFDKSLKRDDTSISTLIGKKGNGDYSIYYYESLIETVVSINVWPPPELSL